MTIVATSKADISPRRLRSSAKPKPAQAHPAPPPPPPPPVLPPLPPPPATRRSLRIKTQRSAGSEAGRTSNAPKPTPARQPPGVLAEQSPSKANAPPQKVKAKPKPKKKVIFTAEDQIFFLAPQTRPPKAAPKLRAEENPDLNHFEVDNNAARFPEQCDENVDWRVEQIARALSNRGGCTLCLGTTGPVACLCSDLALDGVLPIYLGANFVHLGDVCSYDDALHLEPTLGTISGDGEPEWKSVSCKQADDDADAPSCEDHSGIFVLRDMIDVSNELPNYATKTSTVTADDNPFGAVWRPGVCQDVFWCSFGTPDRPYELEGQSENPPESDVGTEPLTATANENEKCEVGEVACQDSSRNSWGMSSGLDGDEWLWQLADAFQGCVDPSYIFSDL